MKILKLLIISCLIMLCLVAKVQASNENHIIIIDTGSTGTRAHIFAYKKETKLPYELQYIYEVGQIRQTPGVTQYINDPKGLEKYIAQLFKKTHKILALQERNNTPVYLFATAGLRNLPKEDQTKLISALETTVAQSIKNNHYQAPKTIDKHVSMITGNAEAMFGWLSVNYLMQKLNAKSLAHGNTYGVVDMGGASTEITFLPQTSPLNHYQGFLFHQNLYLLYSYSYATYGLEQAKRLTSKEYPAVTKHCYPHSGQGDFIQCLSLLQKFVYKPNKVKTCHAQYGDSNCSLMGVYQPKLNNIQFIGIDKYYHVFKILGLADNIASVEQLNKKAQQFCQTPWTTLTALYPNFDKKTLNNVCFAAAWYYTILKGYNLTDNSPFIVTDHIVNQSSDWPLGAAIYLLTQPKLPNSLYKRVMD